MLSTLLMFRAWPQPGEERFASLSQFYDENAVRILSMLPPIAAEILGREGLDTLLRFLQQYGGSRLQLRKRPGGMESRLRVYLQDATCAAILRMLADSEMIDVPSAHGVFTIFRRVAIQLALRERLPPSLSPGR